MLGLGKTGTVHASATVSPARSQEIYQRYAVALYRQALLNPGDPAPAGNVDCAPVVNECALAAMPERGEDDRRYRLAESVFRRSRQLVSGPVAMITPFRPRARRAEKADSRWGLQRRGRGLLRVR